MPVVSIRHLTTYRYRTPVSFGEHRMLLRPLESHDQRILSAELRITPEPALLQNVHDVSGASVTVARFDRRSDVLRVESRVRLEHRPQSPLADLADDVLGTDGAFAYETHELPDLARAIVRRHADPGGEVAAWARRFVRPNGPTRLLDLLVAITGAIRGDFAYALRLQGAPQSPAETLARRSGSCRDFAVLMMEAARSLGLAAQFVSGYVYSASSKAGGRTGGGHTHAWTRVYLPACGWIEFDPTNGIVGATDLVRVAAACDPRQVLPLHGTWAGAPDDYLGMDVEVDVRVDAEIAAQPAPQLRVAQGR
jgi:transglutaminase-like putative cysteine protease